jgi:hypothetical protein
MLSQLLSKLPAPRPADWGFNVTICIAAVCDSRKKIVCINDQRASFKDFSSERLAVKNRPFFENWIALYAGTDMEYVPGILDDARGRLSTLRRKKKRALTPTEVGKGLQESWWAQLESLIECQILRRHGFTLERFLREGKQKCTASFYSSIRAKIDQVKLSLNFLVAGFDKDGQGHILVIDGITPPARYDSVGMWAIGTGATAALSAMSFQADNGTLSVYAPAINAVYCLCEARFMAATASEVGHKGSFLVIISDNGPDEFLHEDGFNRIEEIWREFGAPRFPRQALEEIPGLIYTPKPSVSRKSEPEQ